MNTTLTADSPRKVQWRLPEPPKRRLRDEFADWMRTRNYARATIASYVANVREVALVCAAHRHLIERLCWALKSSAPPSRGLLELAEHHMAAVDTTHVLCLRCGRMVPAQAECSCPGK